jgi:membrane protease YdiL (CAAX protease family)
VVLGYLGWRTPSLWAPIALHCANNLWSEGVLGWIARALVGGR